MKLPMNPGSSASLTGADWRDVVTANELYALATDEPSVVDGPLAVETATEPTESRLAASSLPTIAVDGVVESA